MTQGMGTLGKAVLIALGVVALLAVLGLLALGAILSSAGNGIQNMDPGTFGTFAPLTGSSSPTGAQPGTAAPAALDVQGDRVCDATARLTTALLAQGRLLLTGADEEVVAAQGPGVLVPAREVGPAAALLAEGAGGTGAADLYAVSNGALTLSGLAETAVILAGRDDRAAALSATHDAWEASVLLDRDLRRALVAAGYDPGATSTADSCADPLDMLGWQRMVEASTPS